MKPSSELYDLIHSMTKSEKRYFKLFASLQSGDKNYLKIFDTLESQKVFNEEELKEKFKNETFIKHLPSEKNHLYNNILKSLRNFHSDKSASNQLQEQLRNIEILFKKALYKQCDKLIKKAKKLAYKYEKYYYLLDIIDWEKLLLEEKYQQGIFDRQMKELVDEEAECVEKLNNLAEYHMLYSKILYVYRRQGFIRTNEDLQLVMEVQNHPLIKGKGTAKSVKATTACYFIQGLCALTARNFKQAKKNFETVKKILEDNPPIMEEVPKRYLKTLNNLLTVYLNLKDLESFKKTLISIEDLMHNPLFDSTDIQIKIFSTVSIGRLLLCQIQGNFEEGKKLIEVIEERIKDYSDKISKEEIILLHYTISEFYFVFEDYRSALRRINYVLNDNEAFLRQDIYAFARLYNLIIHYELKNYDLLQYLYPATLRFVKKRKNILKFEMEFLKFFKKIMNENIKTKQRKQLFRDFKKKMIELFENPNESAVLQYFDFLAWINSKIENTSYVRTYSIEKKEYFSYE